MLSIRRPIPIAVLGSAVLLIGVLRISAGADRPAEPTAINPPIPGSPDEPMAQKISLVNAADSLDRVALTWTRQQKCGSCHSTYPFLMARPVLKDAPSPALGEVRRFFEDRVAAWDSDPKAAKLRASEVVGTAAALAINDAQTTGKLHPLTRKALDAMWAMQRKDGAWDWPKCNWPPSEYDDYYGALMAAVGVGMAPDGYARGESAKEGLASLRKYLAGAAKPNLHHKAWLLWASARLEGIMAPADRQTAVAELLKIQRADGGWSMPSLGPEWIGHNGKKSDPDSPSDGYATGLVVFALRQAGVAADDPSILRGRAWLRTHQRASGRWYTASLNGGKVNFMADTGTAFAVLALYGCE